MKTLEDLHNHLVELELKDLAQELAIVRYKARMWDKYQREARIHKDLLQALEVTEAAEGRDLRRIFEENRQELQDLKDQADALLNPHAHDDFASRDASGATYTGHDEEDIPGTARKGEN